MAATPKHSTKQHGFQPGNTYGKGAPLGNVNGRSNIRHGLKGGQLPKDAKYIEFRLNDFRRRLEDCVMFAHGEVSIVAAACIQTCLRWERHAALAQRWLVKAGDTMKPEQKLNFSREIANASSQRDKALAMLRLDRDSRDGVIDALYSKVLPAPNEHTDEQQTT